MAGFSFSVFVGFINKDRRDVASHHNEFYYVSYSRSGGFGRLHKREGPMLRFSSDLAPLIDYRLKGFE